MTRIERLKLNPRLLFWGKALTEVKTLNAVITLFYLHREVSIEQAFYLSVFFSVATLILEVPTGYLADRFGRKRTLLLGVCLLITSQIVTLFAHGFILFVGVFVLLGAAFSCFSGTEEATLYDTLKELGTEHKMTAYNGRQHAARHLMKIFMPTIGALVAADLLEWQFRLLIGFDVIAAVAALFTLALLIEPRHVKNVTAYEKGIFRESIETIKREPFLFRAAMNKLIMFEVTFIVWRAYQPFLFEHGVNNYWFGIFYMLLHGLSFTSHWFVGVVESSLGPIRILHWTVLLTIAALSIAMVAEASWILFAAVLLGIFFQNAREPVFAHAMNQRIGSHSRATTLSNLNVVKGFLEIPIVLVAGYVAANNIENVFMFAVVICVIVLVCFPIRQRDLASPALAEEYLSP